MKLKLFIIVILTLALTACGSEDQSKKASGNEDLKKVTVMLDWVPNTNHTGLYVAKSKGYFEDEGLDVDIVTPGKSSAQQVVGAGKAEFGISSEEYITQARAAGIPVVSIAAILQHNTSGFASPKSKGIASPRDFAGKTYGGWGTPMENAFIKTVMKDAGMDVKNVEDQVNIVNMGEADFFTAVKKNIDFAWEYYGWTGIDAKLRGMPLNMIYLKDISPVLDYYTPTIITSEKMIKQDPDTVKKFMRATAKGYEYAIKHPDESADILIKATPESDAKLIKASQEWMSPRYQADADEWGVQKKKTWTGFTQWMYDNHLIKKKIDSEKAFTNDFLPDDHS